MGGCRAAPMSTGQGRDQLQLTAPCRTGRYGDPSNRMPVLRNQKMGQTTSYVAHASVPRSKFALTGLSLTFSPLLMTIFLQVCPPHSILHPPRPATSQSSGALRHRNELETTTRPSTNTHVDQRSSYDHGFKFQSRLSPPSSGCGRGHCAMGGRAETRRYGTEHAIGSSDLVNHQRHPAQHPGAELQIQRKTHCGQDLSRH